MDRVAAAMHNEAMNDTIPGTLARLRHTFDSDAARGGLRRSARFAMDVKMRVSGC